MTQREQSKPDWPTIGLVVVVIAVLSVVALLVFGQQTSEILSTVSHSV